MPRGKRGWKGRTEGEAAGFRCVSGRASSTQESLSGAGRRRSKVRARLLQVAASSGSASSRARRMIRAALRAERGRIAVRRLCRRAVQSGKRCRTLATEGKAEGERDRRWPVSGQRASQSALRARQRQMRGADSPFSRCCRGRRTRSVRVIFDRPANAFDEIPRDRRRDSTKCVGIVRRRARRHNKVVRIVDCAFRGAGRVGTGEKSV